MRNKSAQASIEYAVCLAILLIIFFAMYQLFFDMQNRMTNLSSILEGEKTSARLSDSIDWALIIGSGSNISVDVNSNPAQKIIASGSQIVSLGVSNQSLSVSPTISSLINYFGPADSAQKFGVFFNGTNISISQLG